jgi:hypothetical protein
MATENRSGDDQPVIGRIAPCRIVDFPEHADQRGRLTVIQPRQDVDFDVRRAFYLHDVTDGADRGAHAHRELIQLLIPVHGSFTVVADDGFRRSTFVLDNPSRGLYVSPMVWCDVTEFAPGTVLLCLASDEYDEADYYRDYDEFRRAARGMAA